MLNDLFMEYLLLFLIIAVAIVSYLSHRRDMKLLCSVSSPTRGKKAHYQDAKERSASESNFS